MSSGFLARWAKRKALAKLAEAERPRRPAPPVATDEAPEETPAPAPESAERAEIQGSGAGDGAASDAAEAKRPVLPDIGTLTLESDFTAFMAGDVPREVRNQALRKLWRMDPVFANLDGLNDYDDDYTDAATVREGMKTAYRIGRGFLDSLSADEDAAVAAANPETEEGGEAKSQTDTPEVAASEPEQETGNG